MDQPCGYVQKGDEHKVYKLKKVLYGLKQAPRAWYSPIEAYFLKEGFEKCDYEHTLFVKINLYVDDLIFTGNDELMFIKFKSSMKHEFDMTDLGKLRYFLGLEMLQQLDGIFLCQKKYGLEMLQRFGMDRSNYVHNPIVPELLAYIDSDYARDLDDRKNTSGYVFLLCSNTVSWSSRKQPIVNLSTTEAEFISAASCACQAI
ncbi:hypothetical protein CR513_45548, partial [Mucuna pruriens]